MRLTGKMKHKVQACTSTGGGWLLEAYPSNLCALLTLACVYMTSPVLGMGTTLQDASRLRKKSAEIRQDLGCSTEEVDFSSSSVGL